MSFDRSSTESLNSPTKDNFVPYRWSRSNTVRKVNSIGSSTPIAFANKEENVVTMKRASADDIDVSNARRMFENMNVEHCFNRSEKLRRSWTENTYRQSLDSISEYKRKNSFTIPPSRECSSFESSSSDCTDYTLRTADLTLLTEHSEYLSWIESLSSDYFTNATQAETDSTITDGKAGEWNNFWLNYNNARNLYLQQQNSYSYNSVPTSEEFLEANINSSNIKKEPSIENPDDLFYMTRAEMLETIKCCQKIIEVLQEVMNKTTAVKVDDIKNDSSHNNGQQKKAVPVDSPRYSLTNMQKPKCNPPKPNLQQPGSCINALFNSGVTDILKRVITKRRDSTESQTESTIPKNYFPFSNWTSR